MNDIDLVREGRRLGLYWKLRNAGVPRVLAMAVARLWPVPGERREGKAAGAQIGNVNRLTQETTMVVTVNVKVSRAFRVRVWLATRIMELAAWVLGCRFEERTAGLWHSVQESQPPELEDVLLWNGLRYLVGIRARDGQYYGLHEAAPFLATHWAWIDPAPGDEDGEA